MTEVTVRVVLIWMFFVCKYSLSLLISQLPCYCRCNRYSACEYGRKSDQNIWFWSDFSFFFQNHYFFLSLAAIATVLVSSVEGAADGSLRYHLMYSCRQWAQAEAYLGICIESLPFSYLGCIECMRCRLWLLMFAVSVCLVCHAAQLCFAVQKRLNRLKCCLGWTLFGAQGMLH